MMCFFEASRGMAACVVLTAFLVVPFSLTCFFGSFLVCLAPFFAPLLALGASFFRLVPFFEAGFSGAPCARSSASAAVSFVLVACAFFMLVLILLAVDPRMTIHHSGRPERQVKSDGVGGYSRRGEHTAILAETRLGCRIYSKACGGQFTAATSV